MNLESLTNPQREQINKALDYLAVLVEHKTKKAIELKKDGKDYAAKEVLKEARAMDKLNEVFNLLPEYINFLEAKIKSLEKGRNDHRESRASKNFANVVWMGRNGLL